MLVITSGYIGDVVKDPDVFISPDIVFDNIFDNRDLDSDFARRVITDIDQIDVSELSKTTVQLLAENELAPSQLCTGTKNLLIAKFLTPEFDKAILLSRMGPNCYKYLVEAGRDHDIRVIATNMFGFTDADLAGQRVYFPRLKMYASTSEEFVTCMSDIMDVTWGKQDEK